MRKLAILLLLLPLADPAAGQFTPSGALDETASYTPTGQWDLSGGSWICPRATTCAATDCDEAGEDGGGCYDTDASSGSRWLMCEFGTGWVAQGSGGTLTSIATADTSVVTTDTGTGQVDVTVDAGIVGTWTAGGLTLGAVDVTDRIILPASADPVTPTLTMGSVGCYEGATNWGYCVAGGSANGFIWNNNGAVAGMKGGIAYGAVLGEAPSITNPSVVIQRSDKDTGLGGTIDNPCLIAGGVTGLCVPTTAGGVNYVDVTPGATGDPATIGAKGEVNSHLDITSDGFSDISLISGDDIHFNAAGGGIEMSLETGALTFGAGVDIELWQAGAHIDNVSAALLLKSVGTTVMSLSAGQATVTGDLIETAPVSGELYEDDLGGATTDITVTTAGTYYGWVTATAGRVSGGVTSDVTVTAGEPGDSLAVPAGDYRASFSVSFSGTNSAEMSCCIFDDDVRTRVCVERTLGAAGASGNASRLGDLDNVGASSVIDLRCTSDSNGDTIAIKTAGLNVWRVGS